jgi:predicted RNA-binding Zn-ribbon protein involved in translation (DUF1610 family)/acetyltransferase-like isoleucine patch superfamily enzyme
MMNNLSKWCPFAICVPKAMVRWLALAALLVLGGFAQAATFLLPAAIGSGPFSSCSFTSGTTYSCTSSVLIDNNDTVNFTQSMTLAVIGAGRDFEVGNNSFVNGNGFAVTITAADDIKLGNSFVGSINFSAGDDFDAGNSATITGNVTAGDDVIFGNSTSVTGDVTASDKLTVGSGTITGNCTYSTTNYTCTSKTLSIGNASVTEGNSGTTTMTFTVTLSTAATSNVAVNYATSNGIATTADSDYVATSGTLTFTSGQSSKTISVTVNGDIKFEANETFTMTLSGATGATISTAMGTGTITNDDTAPTLSIASASFTEGNSGTSMMGFTVTQSAVSGLATTVIFGTSAGSAIAGASCAAGIDYVTAGGTVTIAAGATTGTISVTVCGDLVYELDETLTVTLSSPTNATITSPSATGTISNDDAVPTLSIASASKAELIGGTSNLTFTVTQSAASAFDTTVTYATSPGTANAGSSCAATVDYVTANGTATISAGSTTATINVSICGDTLYEPNETFTVTLSSPNNASILTGTATGTINDDDAMPSLSIASVAMAEGLAGTTPMTFTITLSAASGYNTSVSYATTDGSATGGSCGTFGVDYGTSTGTATIAPGSTTATFVVPVCGDTTLEANESFTVTLSASANATILTTTANGTITNDDTAPSLSIAGVSAAEGNLGTSTMTFTVTQSAASGLTTTVNFATNAGTATVGASCTTGVDYLNASGVVTITAGSTTATIPVTICGDATFEPDETFTVTLSIPANATLATAVSTGTITNDDTGLTLSIASASVIEGNSGTTNLTFTITQSAISTVATTVVYATSNGAGAKPATGGTCGTVGHDYATTSGTATIPIGSTSTTFAVPICGDTTIETDETFTVTLSAASNATISTTTATGTITNDDVCACVPKNGNLIANPDFEELCASTVVQNFGAVSGGTVNMRNGVCGWSMNGTGMETWENTTLKPASSGTVFVELDGYSGTVDCLWQNVTTSPGTDYTLKVDYRARTTTKEGLIVKWNGTQKYTATTTPTTAWETITVPGLTASGNDRIEFCEPSASDNSLGSWIDNVRLQAFFPDHYELSVPSSNVACQASTVKVTACADNSSPCTALATPSSVTVNVGTTAGTLASGTLTFSAGGIATTTLSNPAAADGSTATLTLSGESVPGANARRCCIGSTCSTANTCVATFNTAGFIVSSTPGGGDTPIPTQTAGTSSSTYYLRAVKTGATTQACEAALTGVQGVNWAAQCKNPTTCSTGNLMSLSGNATTAPGSSPIASNPNAGVSSTTSVNMTFDANGNAPFSINYADVGQVTLWASKAASGSLLSALAGSSNAFVTKPGGFLVAGVQQTAAPQLANPGSAISTTPGSTDSKFIKAGEMFSATVSAVTSGGAATPNYGRETAPEGVVLTHALVAPSGGSSGTLSNGTIASGSFANGVATVTNLAWDEVGFISLSARVADNDYLGVGIVSTLHGFNIGRFIPDHFAVTAGTVAPACSNAFTYFGQDFAASPASNAFATPFTLTAQNLSNGITQNYTDGFAKLPLTTWGAAPASAVAPGYGFSAATLPAGATLSASATAPTGSWPSLASAQPSRGVASITAKHKVSRPTALTGITSLTVSAAPVDSDGVTMASTAVGAASNFYYGRLRMLNAYGSELLALPMSLTTEYWTTAGWVKNALDGCTAVPVPTSTSGLAFGAGNLSAGETVASIQGITTGNATLIAGDAGFKLSKPGTGNTGFVTITMATPDWLKFPWVTTGVDVNASARATFGIFKSPLIYRRENY